MSISKISIKQLTVAVLAFLGICTIVLSVVSASFFREAALTSQEGTLTRIVDLSTKQALQALELDVVDMGRGAKKELSRPLSKLKRDSGDAAAKASLLEGLNEQFHQRFVTAGILDVKKLRVYDLELNIVMESKEGVSGLGSKLPPVIYDQAKPRQGAERLKAVTGLWMSKQGPMFSALVPLGGLRVDGYLELVVNPAHNLVSVAEIVQLPLTIDSIDGKQLFQSEDWSERQTNTTLPIAYVLKSPDGEPMLKLLMLEEMKGFYDDMSSTRLFIIVAFVILVVVSISISLWLLSSHLFAPMQVLLKQMGRTAEGDLTVQVERKGLRELVMFGDALAGLISSLRQQVEGISRNSTELASSAEKLAQVTEETSSAAQQQQSESNQMAAAVNELSATATDVANNAGTAANAAKEADDVASQGRRIVGESIQAMNNLAEEVERASDVIGSLEEDTASVGTVLGVIRDIAEQTNLLALNAAIEAARAGEQGRGFAVVADEVRTLAQRTQESTAQIQTTIESLQGRASKAVAVMSEGQKMAEQGVSQAGEAGASLTGISDAITTIGDMTHQIASAAEQQSAVSEEINRSIVTISEATNEMSLGSEHVSKASYDIAQLATELQTSVSRFKL